MIFQLVEQPHEDSIIKVHGGPTRGKVGQAGECHQKKCMQSLLRFRLQQKGFLIIQSSMLPRDACFASEVDAPDSPERNEIILSIVSASHDRQVLEDPHQLYQVLIFT